MRRLIRAALAALLLSLLIGIQFGPVVAQDAATPAAEQIYADPAGQFTVPVPTNWTVDERDGFALLTDPDGKLSIAVVVVTAKDAVTGVRNAWAIVDPEFDADNPAIAQQSVPSVPEVDETVLLTLIDPASGQADQGYGQRVGDKVFVLIFSGTLDAATRRASQIQIIASGFSITSISVTDLSGSQPLRFEGEVVAEFQAYVDDLLHRMDIPGAAIAIVQEGQVVYTEGFGVKELGGSAAITPDTLMMIGSTTKSMTTMMMATEVDDGLMDWDDPVIEIIPSFAVADPELSKSITVRNLVCACTGVPRRDLEWLFNADELSAEDVIESLQDFDFFTEFGEAFQYSNQMVATGGYVAAAATGAPYGTLEQAYADQLRQRVLDPIGMDRTTLSFAEVLIDADHATPHGATLDAGYEILPLRVEELLTPMAPAGGIWSSVNELALYLQTELNRGVAPNGTRIISRENLEETWRPQVAIDAKTDYGLGWMVGESKGLRHITHDGNTFGFSSGLSFLPEVGLGIAILTNAQASGVFVEGVRTRLFELLFEQPDEISATIDFALEQADQAQSDLAKNLDNQIYPDEVAPFIGHYLSDTLGEVDLSIVDERLIMETGEFSTELRPVKNPPLESATYLMADPPLAGLRVELKLDRDGNPEIVIDIATDQYVFLLVLGPEASPILSRSSTTTT